MASAPLQQPAAASPADIAAANVVQEYLSEENEAGTGTTQDDKEQLTPAAKAAAKAAAKYPSWQVAGDWVAGERLLPVETLQFAAVQGQPRPLSEEEVVLRRDSFMLNPPRGLVSCLVWQPTPDAEGFVVLGGQHSAAALQRIREERLGRGEPVPEWLPRSAPRCCDRRPRWMRAAVCCTYTHIYGEYSRKCVCTYTFTGALPVNVCVCIHLREYSP